MRRLWTWVGAIGDDGDGVRPGPGGNERLTPEAFRNLEFRSIGPSLTTGRISDIAVDPKNSNVWYVAVSAGNLWKTENRGNTWTPIFESYGSYSLGAVVVDPKDSNVVWLGTGENNNQRSVSFGDGIYKSTDAGTTWNRDRPRELRAHPEHPHRSRAIRTSSTSARSVRCGMRAAIAASTRRPTAARRGRRFSRSARTPASPTWRWIRRTRTCCTPRRISGAARWDS